MTTPSPVIWKPKMAASVTPEAMKKKDLAHLMPIRLIRLVGWPNRFFVNEVIEIKGKPHLSIWPCCFWLINRKSGGYLCKAHPAEYFEPLQEKVRERKPGDRQTTIQTPWGTILDMDYQEDESSPVFTLRAFGFPFKVGGDVARQLSAILKKAGI